MTAELQRCGRRLAGRALEPFAGQVYFSPECHAEYEKLGFQPSPGDVRHRRGAARRPRVLHQPRLGHGSGAGRARRVGVRGVQPRSGRARGRLRLELTDAADDLRGPHAAAPPRNSCASWARQPDGIDTVGDAARACVRAVATRRPAAVFRAAVARRAARSPMGKAWRLADMLREYRGDAHTAAWTSPASTPPRSGC